MNANTRNVTGFFQPGLFPGFTGIFRFPYAVAVADIAAHGDFAAADIYHVIVLFTDRNAADTAAEKAVADILPTAPAVLCFKNTAAGCAKVVEIGFTLYPRHRSTASAAKRTDIAVLQSFR